MRVISASYTKIYNLIIPTLVTSEAPTYEWAHHSSMKHLTQWQLALTIGMRNLIATTLHEFTSAPVLIHINVYAYLSSNKCFSIWVINPNWTSELSSVFAAVDIHKRAIILFNLLWSHHVLAYCSLSMRSHSWEVIQPYANSCVS